MIVNLWAFFLKQRILKNSIQFTDFRGYKTEVMERVSGVLKNLENRVGGRQAEPGICVS